MKLGVSMNVTGLVQGVGFRFMTKMVADKLNIVGTVKNESDGSVSIVACGEKGNLYQFINQIKQSPAPSGRVDHVKIDQLEPLPAFSNFTVIG